MSTTPKYATPARGGQPKKVIGNKYSKPTTQINLNLDATSQGSKHSGLGSARNGGAVFDRLAMSKGSARQRSNSKNAAINGTRFNGSDMRRRESDQIIMPK